MTQTAYEERQAELRHRKTGAIISMLCIEDSMRAMLDDLDEFHNTRSEVDQAIGAWVELRKRFEARDVPK